jgi:hypothetical protein
MRWLVRLYLVWVRLALEEVLRIALRHAIAALGLGKLRV